MSGWRQRFIVGVDAFYACFETFRRHYVALYSLKHKEIHTFHCKNGLVVELELCKKMSKEVFMKNLKIGSSGKNVYNKNAAANKDSSVQGENVSFQSYRNKNL